MVSSYVEEYAKRRGITVEEAMQHAIIREYLKEHPAEEAAESRLSETKMVAGCGSAVNG